MKLIIEKELLVTNLENVSKALSTRNIIPTLNGIKFEISKKGLYLTATDNEITIEVYIDKKDIKSIEEEGSLVVANGGKLLELLKRINKKDIIIESFEDNEIIFKSEKFEYKSSCFPKEDFPVNKFEESKDHLTFDALKFKEIINKTAFACSNQESRPLLTGINIKIIGDLFECVATNSYRLSKVQIKLDKNVDNSINIVIPAKYISELHKIISKDCEIELHIFSNKVLFIYDNIKFQSSLLNGTYPNTDNSIPKEFLDKIEVNLTSFNSIVSNASLITQIKDKNIVEMEINNNILTIKSNTLEGKFEDSIEVNNINQRNLRIAFNAKYMMDALKIYNKEKILLLMNGEINPIIVVEEDNKEITELIIPMKIF